MKIMKEFHFEAAHQLPPEKECTYGICSRLHGHSYRICVCIQGVVNSDGWIMDFKELGSIVKQHVIDACDHQFLNDVYPNEITTAENLGMIWARKIRDALLSGYPGITLHALEVWETAKCCAIIEESDIASDAKIND